MTWTDETSKPEEAGKGYILELPSSDLETFVQGIMDAFIQAIVPVIEAIIPVITSVYNAIYERYLEVGAPYGETQEGCLRWMEDLVAIKRAQDEVERLVSQHEGLAHLRKRLQTRNVGE